MAVNAVEEWDSFILDGFDSDIPRPILFQELNLLQSVDLKSVDLEHCTYHCIHFRFH